jgi:hypothetical protein
VQTSDGTLTGEVVGSSVEVCVMFALLSFHRKNGSDAAMIHYSSREGLVVI